MQHQTKADERGEMRLGYLSGVEYRLYTRDIPRQIHLSREITAPTRTLLTTLAGELASCDACEASGRRLATGSGSETTPRRRYRILEHETGLEPATPRLARDDAGPHEVP